MNDHLIQLISKAHQEGLLYRSLFIDHYSNGRWVKSVKQKTIPVTRMIMKIPLEEYTYLLVDDYIDTTYFAWGIICEGETIYKVTVGGGITYICDEHVVEIIKTLETVVHIEELSSKEIEKKKYAFTFEQVEKLTALRHFTGKLEHIYVEHEKGSGKIRYLSPPNWKRDRVIIEKENIPHISLAEYFSEYDEEKIKKMLQPYHVYSTKEKVDTYGNTKTIQDFSSDFVIQIPEESKSEFIVKGRSKQQIVKERKKIRHIRLTVPQGDCEVPLWKCGKMLRTFVNGEDFKEELGVELRYTGLGELFLLCSNGEAAKHVNKSIVKELEDFTISKHFTSVKSLLLNYIFFGIKEFIYVDAHVGNDLRQLHSLYVRLVKHIVQSSLTYNKKPYRVLPTSQESCYLHMVANKVKRSYERLRLGEEDREVTQACIHAVEPLVQYEGVFQEEGLCWLANIVYIIQIVFNKYNYEVSDEYAYFFEHKLFNFYEIEYDEELYERMKNIFEHSYKGYSIYGKEHQGYEVYDIYPQIDKKTHRKKFKGYKSVYEDKEIAILKPSGASNESK